MEPVGSLPHSQVPATCPYPEPARSSSYPHILLPEIHLHVPLSLLSLHQIISPGPRLSLCLLAPRPTPKLEYHPLSAFRDCLFNIFAATLHNGSRSSFHNLRTRHAVVTGTHLAHEIG